MKSGALPNSISYGSALDVPGFWTDLDAVAPKAVCALIDTLQAQCKAAPAARTRALRHLRQAVMDLDDQWFTDPRIFSPPHYTEFARCIADAVIAGVGSSPRWVVDRLDDDEFALVQTMTQRLQKSRVSNPSGFTRQSWWIWVTEFAGRVGDPRVDMLVLDHREIDEAPIVTVDAPRIPERFTSNGRVGATPLGNAILHRNTHGIEAIMRRMSPRALSKKGECLRLAGSRSPVDGFRDAVATYGSADHCRMVLAILGQSAQQLPEHARHPVGLDALEMLKAHLCSHSRTFEAPISPPVWRPVDNDLVRELLEAGAAQFLVHEPANYPESWPKERIENAVKSIQGLAMAALCVDVIDVCSRRPGNWQPVMDGLSYHMVCNTHANIERAPDHFAIESNRTSKLDTFVQMIRWLQSQGMDINAGSGAAFEAALANLQLPEIKALVLLGADPTIKGWFTRGDDQYCKCALQMMDSLDQAEIEAVRASMKAHKQISDICSETVIDRADVRPI